MKPLKYYVAMSVDGFICAEDGSIAGFMNQHGGAFKEGQHIDDFYASYEWFDTVLMGRKTYELGLSMGVTNPYPTMKQVVFSTTMKESPDDSVQLVPENLANVVGRLKSESNKAVWLCGGANLATQLFAAKLIDEIIIKLNPVLLGSGIPLFSNVVETADLELTRHKVYSNGLVLLHYSIC